jgi:hypothetical protein
MAWKKGLSGNPRGRPKGSLNKSTLAAQMLLDGEAEVLTEKAIALAKSGDVMALRMCLDRILAPRRDRPLPRIDLPAVTKPEDVTAALNAILQAVATSKITPSEAYTVATVLALQLRATRTEDPAPEPHTITESEIVWRRQILERQQILEGLDHVDTQE